MRITYSGPLAVPFTVQPPGGPAVEVDARTVDVDADLARVLVASGEWAAAGSGPASSVADVKAWVGDDPARAAEALAAELARPNPRSTLVEHLSTLVPQED